MSRGRVNIPSLREAIAQMPGIFHTKDVSSLQTVRSANSSLTGSRNYHAFVGGALSDNAGALGIELFSTGHARGALWRKLQSGGAAATTQRSSASASVPATSALPAWTGAGTPISADARLDPLTGSLVVRAGHFETVRY